MESKNYHSSIVTLTFNYLSIKLNSNYSLKTLKSKIFSKNFSCMKTHKINATPIKIDISVKLFN